MPNTFNYAEKYNPLILEAIQQGALTTPFYASNVEWTGAKTFHFTQMSVSGYQDHKRTGGWNKGTITQTDVDYTVTHDRDISFLVDKADVDESARTAAMINVTKTFVNDKMIPEIDAYTFSKIAAKAKAAGLFENTNLSTYTVDNIYTKLVQMMGKTKLKHYRARGTLIGYVRSEIMDLLALSKELSKSIETTRLTGPTSVETRIARINGVPLIEVIDSERFYDAFDYDDGFEPVSGTSRPINILFAATDMVHTVPKISSIYYFSAGIHTEGDGDLYQNRAFWDTFVFPNGKDNKIDSIYVSLDAAIE